MDLPMSETRNANARTSGDKLLLASHFVGGQTRTKRVRDKAGIA